MLAKSKREFHEMFKRTYGIIYEQNSYVFTDLFDELERYYAKGRVDLIEAMDNFFNTLYQKMFTVLNAQYNFNDKYLECVSEHMKELKPFGDVPNKLSVQLKRSFVATRTFGQALTLSASIVSSMQNIVMSSSCNRAVAKMTHCPACSGLNELKPCSNYCTNVMKGCLAYHSQLDSYWNAFIDALDKVVERLLGPFNIEMVVEPIDIKISEAIMNFQENSQQVSQRVFTGCGKPVLGRRKRSNGELSFETLQFSTNNGKSGKKQQQQAGGDGMDRVVKETRTRLKDTRQFWQKLPYHMCGTTVAEEKESCWNGEKKDKYSPAVVGDGMSNQQNNPEVDVDINRPNSLVNEQIFALKTITNKLKNAYNGMDVEWIDIEETYGSGSGSGGGPDDSDMEDNGSGMPGHPLEPEVEHPSTRNNEDNRLHPMGDSNGKVNYNFTTTDNSIGGGAASMTLNRALFSYLMPIVMMWFGNTVTEWLQ
ncbi:hypothetical protein AAG570_000313 [Ranatra chinensis]|uniref:Glypican-6 n=1 Tax=Ranatra chinensis TaxID=642074 RepID=A0ABD0YWP6_9HEMI